MENRKLWIIGDSFTGSTPTSWILKVCEQFIGEHYYVSSRGSRDIQTIFDIFLHKLHKIQPNDIVILFLPTLSRFRLPLETPYIDVEWTDDLENKITDINMNSMIGNMAYVSISNDTPSIEEEETYKKQLTLAWPLNYINPNMFEPTPIDTEPNFASISQMINTSNAFVDNWNRILKSVQSYVPFKLLYYSWTDEYNSDCVVGKSEITSNLGFWEKLDDVWKETNGEQGIKDDFHWSPKMHELFANYIIQTNSEYFNK
jgi:hypothetical protein